MFVRWVALSLVLVLLARPSAAYPTRFAIKAGKDCTRHPDAIGDLQYHTLGNLADRGISFTITNAATGKQVPALLCPGVKYNVALDFSKIGSGHHLLTSTYGTFGQNVCFAPTPGACKNRACPGAEGSTATNSLTMPCTLPDGANVTGVDNVIRVSWGDGVVVNSNRVTYKFGGTGCTPCGPPPVPPSESPSPSPSPRPTPATRLIVRAASTNVTVNSIFSITVRLVGYTANMMDDSIDARLAVQSIPGTADPALSCNPLEFNLRLQGDQGSTFVVDPETPVTCRAVTAGRARVRVALETSPALANVSAVVSVRLRK